MIEISYNKFFLILNPNKVLIDVHQMKGRQETMDTKLLQIRRENEALWTELATLRQKHAKQQQIVSKVCHIDPRT